MEQHEKIRLHYLLGDVHYGGHDVHRVAVFLQSLLAQTGAFEVMCVCDEPRLSDITFDDYFSSDRMDEADVFVFNCGNYRFNIPEEQHRLEGAVARGAGFVFLHGDHPWYWVEAGMRPWAEVEKMAGLMWREPTRHGDYADAQVRIDAPEHPVTRGLPGFQTRDEIFCTCANVHGVPLEVLASAYSDPNVVSRHGLHGTGAWEP
ncbi:MAG: ThuA domain-containing protein, partial [Clostridia bacterium]|nr:ThuA domain-containing protein [Clostridia bacterium]